MKIQIDIENAESSITSKTGDSIMLYNVTRSKLSLDINKLIPAMGVISEQLNEVVLKAKIDKCKRQAVQ